MSRIGIDINADVGEGIGNEHLILPLVSSCNIACGGHAGDKTTMYNCMALAAASQVKIGAHPSFPDKENFGRLPLDMDSESLFNCLVSQLEDFREVLMAHKSVLHHIKPHGALYNLAAKDDKTAAVILKLMRTLDPEVKLYAPYGSVLATMAEAASINVVLEAFADRNYNDDLSLVSRNNTKAIIHDPEAVLRHCLSIILDNQVICKSAAMKAIKATTICVHGDHKNTVELLRYLHDELPKYGVTIS